MSRFRHTYLALLIFSCGVQKTPNSQEWQSKYGNKLFITKDSIIYEQPVCKIKGQKQHTYDNYLNWFTSLNTCTNDPIGTYNCYFAVSREQEHGNFVCHELDIKEAFYRVN